MAAGARAWDCTAWLIRDATIISLHLVTCQWAKWGMMSQSRPAGLFETMGNGPNYRDGVVFCSQGVSLPKRPYNLATRGRCLY